MVTSATKVKFMIAQLLRRKTRKNLIIHNFFTIKRVTNNQMDVPRDSTSKLENT